MLYEIESVGHFIGIRLEKAPDESRILSFRHLLERHGLVKVLFETTKEDLADAGLMLIGKSDARDDYGCQYPCGAVIEEEPERRR